MHVKIVLLLLILPKVPLYNKMIIPFKLMFLGAKYCTLHLELALPFKEKDHNDNTWEERRPFLLLYLGLIALKQRKNLISFPSDHTKNKGISKITYRHSYKYTLWALHKEPEKLVDIAFLLAGADFTHRINFNLIIDK